MKNLGETECEKRRTDGVGEKKTYLYTDESAVIVATYNGVIWTEFYWFHQRIFDKLTKGFAIAM